MKLQFQVQRETIDAALLRAELAAALGAPFGTGWGGVFTDSLAEVVLFPEREADVGLVAPVVNAHVAAAPQRKADADALVAADVAAHESARANAVVQYLVAHTPAECAAYVNTQVTTLAEAKAMLANFAMALCVLSRKELR